MSGRLLPHLVMAGDQQMALDRLLVDSGSRVTLRFYSWQPWTLSLGWHQSLSADQLLRAEQMSIPLVRRDTGGRAVFHADELTYAIVVPAADPLVQLSLQDLYLRINRALAMGLQHLGAPVTMEQETPSLKAHYQKKESQVCFSQPVQTELLLQGRKVAGSAQRRFSEGILQHGSILLGPAHETIADVLFPPEEAVAARERIRHQAACLDEVWDQRPDLAAMIEALTHGFVREFNLGWQMESLTGEEQQKIEKLRSEFQIEPSTALD